MIGPSYCSPLPSPSQEAHAAKLYVWENSPLAEDVALGGGMHYDAAVLPPDIVTRWMQTLCGILALTAHDPAVPMAELRERVSVMWQCAAI